MCYFELSIAMRIAERHFAYVTRATNKLKIIQRCLILIAYHITINVVMIKDCKSVNGQST